jgi:Phytanoyl-CoA dioxygenase (PhyH)
MDPNMPVLVPIFLLPVSLVYPLIYCLLFSVDGLKRRMIRGENGTYFDNPSPDYDLKDFVSLEVKSGSLVVLHGDLVHQRYVHIEISGKENLKFIFIKHQTFVKHQRSVRKS